MGKWALWLGTLSLLTGGCEPQRYHADTPSVYESARSCAQVNQDNFYASDAYATFYLTVATGDPAFPPWWKGGTTREHPQWKLNDPYLGRGYEGAVTFEVAKRMGFRRDRVTFAPIGFHESFAPGPKPADFVVQQISSTPQRARNVDFSEGYYVVRQALVSMPGSPTATVTSLDQLKDARLGAPADTTGLREIEHTIRPSTQPTVFDDMAAAVRGLKDGRVDGIVVDLASASYIATVQVPEAVIVGRLPTSDPQEHFAMALVNGSPITQCVNIALQEMKDDGTLAMLRKRWLGGTTGAPLIEG